MSTRTKILIGLLLLVPFMAPAIGSEETVLVTASRTPIGLSKSTSSVTLITEKDITRRQAIYLSDLLRLTPGLSISSSGGRGKTTQIRMRGAEGNHVMVLLDGIEVNDPAGGDEFDLATFTTSNIERIEIIRGPQSALWGSDAVAGVINIISKEPGDGVEGKILLENGSYGTDHQNFHLSIGRRNYGLSVGIEHTESGGTNISRFGSEEDGYEIFSGYLKSSVNFFDKLSMKLTARYEDAESETDSGFPIVTDSPGENKTRKSFVGSIIKNELFDGGLINQINLNWTSTNNNNVDGANSSLDKTSADKYEITYQSTGSIDSNFIFPLNHQLTFAIDHEHQRFRQRGRNQGFGDPNQNRHIKNTGLIGEYQSSIGSSFSLSGAVRRDINSDYNDVTTFKIGSLYNVPLVDLRLKVNYSTGQKNPTFIERFGFFLPDSSTTRFEGNSSLRPEKATGWQIGLERKFLNDQLVVGATWFREKLEDEINGFAARSDGVFTALNVEGTSLREGLEFSLNTDLSPGFSIQTNYTYLDATELDSGRGRRLDEVRRPRHSASLVTNWTSPSRKIEFNTFARHSGEFFDLDFSQFPPARTKLDAFTLVGFNLSYDVSKFLRTFLRVENALDEHYEEIIGFKTPGMTANIGIILNYGD